MITAILITINWGGYILAVNLGRVVEASMGYFLSPVINMIGGYIFFHERISKLKQLAVLFATVGALYYVFSGDYISMAWIFSRFYLFSLWDCKKGNVLICSSWAIH
ncbi:MAG: hypothetical protein ACJ0HV_01000 [Candidatus Pseudothioglobus sp.]